MCSLLLANLASLALAVSHLLWLNEGCSRFTSVLRAFRALHSKALQPQLIERNLHIGQQPRLLLTFLRKVAEHGRRQQTDRHCRVGRNWHSWQTGGRACGTELPGVLFELCRLVAKSLCRVGPHVEVHTSCCLSCKHL